MLLNSYTHTHTSIHTDVKYLTLPYSSKVASHFDVNLTSNPEVWRDMFSHDDVMPWRLFPHYWFLVWGTLLQMNLRRYCTVMHRFDGISGFRWKGRAESMWRQMKWDKLVSMAWSIFSSPNDFSTIPLFPTFVATKHRPVRHKKKGAGKMGYIHHDVLAECFREHVNGPWDRGEGIAWYEL